MFRDILSKLGAFLTRVFFRLFWNSCFEARCFLEECQRTEYISAYQAASIFRQISKPHNRSGTKLAHLFGKDIILHYLMQLYSLYSQFRPHIDKSASLWYYSVCYLDRPTSTLTDPAANMTCRPSFSGLDMWSSVWQPEWDMHCKQEGRTRLLQKANKHCLTRKTWPHGDTKQTRRVLRP